MVPALLSSYSLLDSKRRDGIRYMTFFKNIIANSRYCLLLYALLDTIFLFSVVLGITLLFFFRPPRSMTYPKNLAICRLLVNSTLIVREIYVSEITLIIAR